MHGGGADVAYFTAVDDVVKGAHDFLGGNIRIEAVDLEDVDVGAEPVNVVLVRCGS